MEDEVVIVGAGLAGSEAAWQLAQRGVRVRLFEMRPVTQTAVHKTGDLAELVCSNSMKSLDATSAAGSLKYELAVMGSRLLYWASQNRVAAGKALAVDRDGFARAVTEALSNHPNITIERAEFTDLQKVIDSSTHCIIASGPLTSDSLEAALAQVLGTDHLAFFDAAAPIVEADSLNLTRLFSQSRYEGAEAGGDYLNAAMNRDEYERFINELIAARRVINHDFETSDLFQACQPIEEVARTGLDTLRYGALKPVGIIDPVTGRRPWAVVQLRAENSQRSSFNLVGFQTNLAFAEQERVFRMIPGLEQASFARYGVMHRNTFIDAPRLLTGLLAWRSHPRLHFAGQVSGTEGYVEAIASGLVAALAVYADLKEIKMPTLPEHTVFGALLAYATNPETNPYQPMHVNYGIMPALADRVSNKQQRYAQYAARAAQAITAYRLQNPGLDWLPQLNMQLLFG